MQGILDRVLKPMSDHRGSKEYRLEVSKSLVEKFQWEQRAVKTSGTSVPHESARGHVTGEALYVDDLCGRYPNLLHAWPVCAPHAHALVTELDGSRALEEPGVTTVLTQADVPGEGRQRSEPS